MHAKSMKYLEKLQNELAEAKTKNRLLEEFIEKSHISQENFSKGETIPTVAEDRTIGDIRIK